MRWLLSSFVFVLACGDNLAPSTDAAQASDASPPIDADPAELRVVGSTPPANALVTGTDSVIEVAFDRPVARGSVTESTLWAFGQWSGAHRGGYSFAEDDQRVTIQSGRALIPGELVTVVVANSITGEAGSSMRSAGFSYQFRVGSKPANMNFVEIANLSSKNTKGDYGQSYGGIAADLNLDGYPEIAVINERSEDLVVFMNGADGTGMLSKNAVNYRLGIRPSPNESSDFNGDGKTDIAVANIGSGISVLLGNGDGSFVDEVEYDSGTGPRGIAVFDADGDGDMDIVNSNAGGDGDLSLLVNNGQGVFGAPVQFDGGCNREWGLSAADMNSDGITDLVVGCHGDGIISVLTGDGAGGFNLRSTTQGPTGLWMIVTGDLNGDGHADVTVAGGYSNNAAILLGDGEGALGKADLYGTDPSTSATDVGDLDGDGDLDWITSSFGGSDSDWYFWRNDGAGTFSKIMEWDSPEDASCALLVDLDLDGDLDLGLIDEAEDRLILLRND